MKLTILLLTLSLASCALFKPTPPASPEVLTDDIYEKMLPNGNWELSLYSKWSCADKIKNDPRPDGVPEANPNDPTISKKCEALFQSRIAKRASTLCAGSPNSFYGCALTNDAWTPQFETPNKLVYSCYSKCLAQ